MFETIRSVVQQQRRSIDMDVTIPDEVQHETMRKVCDGDGRWLMAATPNGSEIIWLLGGDADEPTYDATKQQRVVDAVCHETMHIVISHVESDAVSEQYDDLLYDVIGPTTYLHYYARSER